MPGTTQGTIDFGNNQESGYEEIAGAQPLAMNVVVDAKGTVSKRPGISQSTLLPNTTVDPNGVVGMYSTNDGQIYAVGGGTTNRNIYNLTNGLINNISTGPNETLTGNNRPTFTETEVFLVTAGGVNIQKVNLLTNDSSRLQGNPPLSTHVTANSSRLLANDTVLDKTKVRFSGISIGTVDTSGHETWDVTGLLEDGGFFTAEARPDPVVAIHENTNEVFVFGTDNVQVFSPDAASVFAPSATREFGLSAPYSVIRKDQEFFWLDQYRRIVYSNGRTFNTIEKPIKQQLDSMERVDDAFGYRVLMGHIDCFVWTFPSDGRTFAYQAGGGWSQWSSHDPQVGNFVPLKILSHHLSRSGGKNLVGTVDGLVGELKQEASSDLGDLIVSRVESGFIDRDSDNRKLCRSIKVTARRGSASTQNLGTLEWRDGSGAWNGPLQVDFGTTGDNYVVKEFRGLGTYRRRQWRFTFSNSEQLSLVRVTETFDILGT
jgi:hypothetical protein